MSKFKNNMQVLAPGGVAVTTCAAEERDGQPWWWTSDANGVEEKWPESELIPLLDAPSLADIETSRYEVSARTLKVEAVSPGKESHSLKLGPGIRVTHIPTGLTVEHVKYRSQHQNRDRALHILRSRLVQLRRTEAGEK
ncbi:peptide chain release factor family protein [Marinobacter salicampi]|uniref:peptide chain release factor family protein n=1 Tax=Marinobacter salicampi TaxID=435907 RepID=UPI001A950F48|nr:peptide chain release factor-like protein [Marinobacter salicampi]